MDEECLLTAKIGRKEILKEKLDAKGMWEDKRLVDEERRSEDLHSTEDYLVLPTKRPIVSTADQSKYPQGPEDNDDPNKVPMSKLKLLQKMLDLGLEVERESFVDLDLIRFIKQQIDEE
ncbi:hypothetical protein Tco_0802779 [Tanacetum coccineum]|uniref:Uncharacterized protein n=1 Tax=Tanacetum coccineum TaxID=301880 RepID=A0ABQ5A2K7_9ASTR